ncbi:tyrosine-type recombinase/integrase [Aequorivita capsosiphonis]|uniref:tyrosine-type recombinase/integrase n=1 Tax=Aequorivita capsosiphonis TaxID=487317 RepID=UPI0004032A8B|nr:site-specific integrase [Aequorivita capsosiphonis]
MAKDNEDVSISFFFNTSRADKNGNFKVALQVYFKPSQKRKYYATKFAFTEKDYTSTWETVKPRKEFKPVRKEMMALLTKADKVAGSLNAFNFEDFERLMFNKTTTDKNVNYYFSKKIEACLKRDGISTAKNYETALKCLLRFHKKPNLNFVDVTVSWLDQFEKFCIEDEEKSLTTVGIYSRTLRTVFNDAIEDKTVSKELYPFGKRKYQIPTPKKVKKALTPQQLKTLFTGTPKTPEQIQAKAFWFFSYLCNGMNFKDLLHLKCKDFDGEKIEFIRAKTAKSVKDLSPITVYPDPYAIDILYQYGNPNGSPNDYIFNILSRTETAEQQYRKVKNFIRLNNQHFLKYAKDNGIIEKVSSYWARHSFTTMAIRKGASMEQVGEAVGHTNTKTTQGYFAGFEDETKKQIGSNLLDF